MKRSNRGRSAFGHALFLLLIVAAGVATAASPDKVAFSAPRFSWQSGTAAVVVTVNRVGNASGSVVASYLTFDGTAVAGTDYVPTAGTVSWSDGDAAPKSFVVPVTPGGMSGNRSFTVALLRVSGALFGSPLSATVSSGRLFPQIGVQAIANSQFFPPANDAQLAQYGLIIMGGNYPYWPVAQGRTRDEIVLSLKGQAPAGPNAVSPAIFQYENANELSLSNPWFPEWNAAVIMNNWFLYQVGASGAPAQSLWNSSLLLVDPDHVVGTDPLSGKYPYGLLADLMYQRYYLGTGSGGPAMASTHLDGYFLDNLSQQNLAGSQADWERNGTDPGRDDPVATAQVTLGKADYPTELALMNPAVIAGGNADFGYDMSPLETGGLGISFSYLSGTLGLSMQQFEWGTAGGESNVLDFAGFSAAMTWYQTLESNTRPGGYAVMTGGVLATDYQLVRYSLALTLMRNGWAMYATNVAAGDSVSDVVDPSDLSTFPVFDEFWGGTLNTAGYLGASVDSAQGAEQSGPWLQGVWRRDFVSGIALVNPNTNGPQTVALGGTFWHLSGAQAPAVNNGAAVTSVTIPPGDGLILLRAPPPR